MDNSVPHDSSRSIWRILRSNAFTLFNAIVGGSFVLLLVLGQWRDALFGFAALGNALIGIVQEYRAKRSLDRLAVLQHPTARVLRDRKAQDIRLEDVVVDDLLVLRAGDQVVADALLLQGEALEVDESLLTGESEPVVKLPGMEVLSGSNVVGGRGEARVIRVGTDSIANRIAVEAKRFSLVASEIRRGINKVLRWITWFLLPVTALIANGQMQAQGGWDVAWESGSWKTAMVGAVAAVIAMIPLGLVLLTSVAFAVGAVRLAKENVLIQELAAVEGLARVDVLCVDKTGTLTEGKVVFDAVHLDEAERPPGWQAALAWFGADPAANATARCLAAVFSVNGVPGPDRRIAFSSATKWSALSFAPGHLASGIWVLGAPEILGTANSPTTARTLARAASLASEGLRTLALVRVPGGVQMQDNGGWRLPPSLEPALLVTFREEIRPDAKRILSYFAEQGVSVRIISGDDPRTVSRVAHDVGLAASAGYDARKLPLDPHQLEDVVENHTVFGRVRPEQKKDLVQALERKGHTVAMIGDGVNDALALKEASIGIAMDSAAPATKAVARLVLLDGRFDRLPSVLAEGRRVIANIERISVLFLSKTTYAVILAVIFGVLSWEFPFLPRQLSVTDGLTIGIPAFFLALMPNHRRHAPGFLRRSLHLAVPAGIIVAAVVTGIAAFAGSHGGYSSAATQTASIVALCLLGFCILAIVSAPIHRQHGIIIAAMCAGLVLVLEVPVSEDFLAIEWPPPELLVVTAAASSLGAMCFAVLARVHRGTGTQCFASEQRGSKRARSAGDGARSGSTLSD